MFRFRIFERTFKRYCFAVCCYELNKLYRAKMSGRFSKVEMAPAIEVFHLNKAYQDDPFEKKVSLGAGAYRTEVGQPWVLPVVRLAEKNLAADETLNKEYFPMLGLDKFCCHSVKMLLGEKSEAYLQQRAFGVQTLSGTGALRVGAEFLRRVLDYKVVYVSDPSWENHILLFNQAGFETRRYRYWSAEKRGIDWDGLVEDLENAPEDSVVVLHACAHNPTGCDPTHEQWKQIADICESRKLFPFFDSAYQGFASGDLDRDAWAVRYFLDRGFEIFCAQSFSKNFGLYNERTGNLIVVPKRIEDAPMIKSQMSIIVRAMYSNPPSHGARIVAYVLNNNDLYNEWRDNVKTMSGRIIEMRKLLRSALERLGAPGTWEHITTQIGMFSYTGLNEIQSRYMIEKHHIYMLKSGRISMCGLTSANVEYVAQAIYDTLTSVGNKL